MTTVWCTTKFEGWHRWPNAPVEHAYLSSSHRHMFGVRVELSVNHSEREVEFINLKHVVEEVCMEERIFSRDHLRPTSFSCEVMAEKIIDSLRHQFPTRTITVTVDEDGENGATVERIMNNAG